MVLNFDDDSDLDLDLTSPSKIYRKEEAACYRERIPTDTAAAKREKGGLYCSPHHNKQRGEKSKNGMGKTAVTPSLTKLTFNDSVKRHLSNTPNGEKGIPPVAGAARKRNLIEAFGDKKNPVMMEVEDEMYMSPPEQGASFCCQPFFQK